LSPVEVQDRTESVRVLEGVQYGVSTNAAAGRALAELGAKLTIEFARDPAASITLTWTMDAGFANELGRGKLTWRAVITTNLHRLERWEP
jgi:hypothetical protein